MADLYTKNGRPLRRSGDDVFSRSGKHVGRVRGSKVYAPDGRYAGTIVGNRVVYCSVDSAGISSPFALRASAGWASASRGGPLPSVTDTNRVTIKNRTYTTPRDSARTSANPRLASRESATSTPRIRDSMT